MAETQKTRGGKKPVLDRAAAPAGSLVMGRRNVLALVAGILVLIIGYILLGKGSLTAAPVLLVLGYCVIIPLSLILWVGKPDDKTRGGAGE